MQNTHAGTSPRPSVFITPTGTLGLGEDKSSGKLIFFSESNDLPNSSLSMFSIEKYSFAGVVEGYDEVEQLEDVDENEASESGEPQFLLLWYQSSVFGKIKLLLKYILVP